METARDLLEAERAQTLARLASLTVDYGAVVDASRDSNADDEHDPEGATIAFERSQIGSLVREMEHRLGEIEAAMGRLDSRTYGRCERCREEIDARRLEARPTARTCLRCVGDVPGRASRSVR